jgi:protein-L-isoaspartate(D-aspartate) O-methyltransferase
MKSQESPAHLADALVQVPRHAFIPDQAWATASASRGAHWIDRHDEPQAWWEAVYSDAVIYTQLDDGSTALTAENAAKTFSPTSSASSPLLINAFLRQLDPLPGDRVLEIGTGTGWTTGLLSYLTGGDEHVTSVEIDAALSAVAERNLDQIGMSPRLVIDDGEKGTPSHAPFDRIHVTCGVREIPYAWIEQTRPGGIIVLPYEPVARLLRLTVHEDGTAIGPFRDQCSFMLLRSQRPPAPTGTEKNPRSRNLDTDPGALLNPTPGLATLLRALVGGVPFESHNKGFLVCGDSHAVVENGSVIQRGPRSVWDEAEEIYRGWKDEGRPGLDRIGATVTREQQYVWIDNPRVPLREQFTATKG